MQQLGLHVIGRDLGTSMALARAADAAGFDAVWGGEFYFTSATVKLAAWTGATERCALGSSIMYGVGRSPLVIAAEARDLDELSGGRLILGLGNGTRRMMSDWHGVADTEAPASRMEELVPLVRRLLMLHTEPVHHEGRFYRVDMRATAPAPPPVRERIPIYTAGVRPRMIQAAGRVADGLVGHPLCSPGYISGVVRPAIEKGAGEAGRHPSEVCVVAMVICAVHDDDAVARREAARQIAFYSSVRSYEQLLDLSGFAEEGARIRTAFRDGDLAGMVAAVTDEMIDEIAVTGSAAQVRERLARFAKVADHVMLYPPSVGIDPDRVEANTLSLIELGAVLRAAASPSPERTEP